MMAPLRETAASHGKERHVAKADVDDFRERLLEHRQEILNLYQRDLRAGQASTDEGTEDIVDRANNSYNRELMFSLSDAERNQLLAVDAALERIEEGSYGKCINCGKDIGEKRLEAVPWARYCIDCQEMAEQGMLNEAS
jgi:DnaK suppressor protein